MIFSTTFAEWKLRSAGAFLYVLIRDGEAGHHERIGEDYPMLELAGTIQVVGTGQHARMRLLQADVAEAALEIIDERGQNREANQTVAAIGEQQAYTHLERERGKLANEVSLDSADAQRLISALEGHNSAERVQCTLSPEPPPSCRRPRGPIPRTPGKLAWSSPRAHSRVSGCR